MATMRTASPWRDPRTGIWQLRKRIPTHLRAASGRTGDTVKISTGTADRAQAIRVWPDVLRRYADMEADWARKANVVDLTSDRARELAARWAAWIAGDPSRLKRAGERHWVFQDSSPMFIALAAGATSPRSRAARRHVRLTAHAEEAAELAGVVVSASTATLLHDALLPVALAAYKEADDRDKGITAGEGPKWNPLATARAKLPAVDDIPPSGSPSSTSLRVLYEAWKTTATVKPRTAKDTGYILELLVGHLGHVDAARITRADLAGWRDAIKADGKTNTTWNNRLSLVRQVFEWGVTEGHLSHNPADDKLRLKKQRAATRLPYSDADTVRILQAARRETRPSLRWAPWIMAFSGMRVGEVLQLGVADVRQDGGIWLMAVHEDDPEKSVKTGQRRSVPIHPAVISEGFLTYLGGLDAAGPVFPDKRLDPHGNRGGRAWNVTGEWVRNVVGITDPAKAPNHSFRHRMEDELRAAEVAEDVRDAILGHARKTTGRQYGVRGEALKRLHAGLSKVPVPAALDLLSDP